MAQITTLKDNEGKKIYPITSAKAVFDENGVDLDTRLNNKVEKEQGKGLSSNDYTDAEKQKLTALPTSETLNNTLNGKQSQLEDSEDVTLNGNKLTVTELAKREVFDDMWINAGLVNGKQYSSIDRENLPEAPYILNGIAHTYEEALHTYKKTAVNYEGDLFSMFEGDTKLKTNFPPPFPRIVSAICHNMFSGCSSLEVVVITPNYCSPKYANNLFSGCKNLEEIRGIIGYSYADYRYWVKTFANCVKLKEIRLQVSTGSLSFADSPLLSYDSFKFMIDNPVSSFTNKTKTLTLTVHAGVYAKLTGDTTNDAFNNLSDEEKAQWTALVPLALEKNISFATI